MTNKTSLLNKTHPNRRLREETGLAFESLESRQLLSVDLVAGHNKLLSLQFNHQAETQVAASSNLSEVSAPTTPAIEILQSSKSSWSETSAESVGEVPAPGGGDKVSEAKPDGERFIDLNDPAPGPLRPIIVDASPEMDVNEGTKDSSFASDAVLFASFKVNFAPATPGDLGGQSEHDLASRHPEFLTNDQAIASLDVALEQNSRFDKLIRYASPGFTDDTQSHDQDADFRDLTFLLDTESIDYKTALLRKSS